MEILAFIPQQWWSLPATLQIKFQQVIWNCIFIAYEFESTKSNVSRFINQEMNNQSTDIKGTYEFVVTKVDWKEADFWENQHKNQLDFHLGNLQLPSIWFENWF